jgi:dTDP-4-dehydrorhamnose reductase
VTLARIVITGASGLLGSNLTLAAADAGHSVTALYGGHEFHPPGVASCGGDLLDEPWVDATITSASPDCVIHCAALTDIDRCEADPARAHAVNVEATLLVAKASQRCGARFVYVSTDAVFDGAQGHYSEDSSTAPVNEYGRSKLLGERAAQEGASDPLVIRTNMFGWNCRQKTSLAEWILGRLRSGDVVPGFTDIVFSPLLVNDLAVVMLGLLEAGVTGLYNVGSRQAMSKYEFAREVAVAYGFDPQAVAPTEIGASGLTTRRPLNTSLRVGKAEGALRCTMPSIQGGVDRFRRLEETGYVDRLRAAGGRSR